MRILTLAFAGLLSGTAAYAAGDALVIGNSTYNGVQTLFGATQVAEAAQALRDKGFDVIEARDAKGAAMTDGFRSFVSALGGDDGPVIVVLAGAFAHGPQGNWLLPATDGSGLTDAAVMVEAFPIETTLNVLAQYPGEAVLVLAESRVAPELGEFLSAGVGALRLPEGVTVLRGAEADVARFVSENFRAGGVPVVEAAKAAGLSVEGAAPAGLVLVSEEDGPIGGAPGGLPEDAPMAEAQPEAEGMAEAQPEAEGMAEAQPEAEGMAEAQPEAEGMAEAQPAEAEAAPAAAPETVAEAKPEASVEPAPAEPVTEQTAEPAENAAPVVAEAADPAPVSEPEPEVAEAAESETAPEMEPVVAEASKPEVAEQTTPEIAETTEPADTRSEVEIAADDAAWRAARIDNSETSYQAYLAAQPNGVYRNAASQRIKAIKADPFYDLRRAEYFLGLDREARRDIQRNLDKLGHYDWAVDGIFGDGTRDAVRAWQKDAGLEPTGYLDLKQIARLESEAGAQEKRAEERQARAEADARRKREEAAAAARAAEEERRQQQDAAAPVRRGPSDAAAWAEVERLGSEAAVRRYLSNHPNGARAQQARQMLQVIERMRGG